MSNGNLGNLWYELDIKDNSEDRLKKIILGIETQLKHASNKGITIGNVKLDPAAGQQFLQKLNNVLASGSLKIGKINLGSDVKFNVDAKYIQSQLDQRTFTGKLYMDVDAKALQQSVERIVHTLPKMSSSQVLPTGLSASAKSMNEEVRKLNTNLAETKSLTDKVGDAIIDAFSVHAIKTFLQNIIEVGGELQRQQLAMGTILGDLHESHELYKQVAELSMISPFDVQDIMKATKQLSAYGVEYNDLYNKTKRLSDIAAGVGVDFGRIAYAYGHVTAGVFDARVLKQFQNMGIPLLKELSNYYSEISGKMVTIAEVRKMITAKAVRTEDIDAVFEKMTNAGGQFYQMQEVMAESLASKWRNLGNAVNLTFGKMADGALGEGLKKVAEALTHVALNFEEFVPTVASALTAFLAYKKGIYASAMQVITASKMESAAVNEAILVEKRKVAALLEEKAATGTLTAAQRQYIANQNVVTMNDIKLAAANGQLSAAQIKQLVTSQQLTRVQAMRLALTSGISKAEIRAAFSTNMFTTATNKAVNAMLSLGKAVPYVAMFAVFDVVTRALIDMQQQSERTKQAIEELSLKGSEGSKNIAKSIGENSLTKDASGKYTASADEIQQAINNLKETLREYDDQYYTTFNDTEVMDENGRHMTTLADQYETLRKRAEELKIAYDNLGNKPDLAISADNIVGEGALKLSYGERLKVFTEGITSAEKYLNELSGKGVELDKIYNGIYNSLLTFGEYDKHFTEDQMRRWQNFKSSVQETDSDIQKFIKLLQTGLDYPGASLVGLSAEEKDIITKMSRLSRIRIQLEADEKEFATSFGNILESNNINKTDEGYETTVRTYFKNFVDWSGVDSKYQDIITKGFADRTGMFTYVEDPNAGKKNTVTPTPPTTTPKGDKELEEWRNRLRLLKEAYAEYKKWYDLYNDEESAKKKAMENPLFADLGNIDPSALKANIDGLAEEVHKQLNNDKNRKAFEIQVRGASFDIDYDKAKEAAAKAVSEVKDAIERETKNWNLYKKLFEATGNKAWSNSIAFGDGLKVLWDDETKRMRSEFKMEDVFDWTMDKESAKAFFNSDAVAEQYMALKKRIEENYINFWGDYATNAKGLQTIEGQLRALAEKRNEILRNAPANADTYVLTRSIDEKIGELKMQQLKRNLNWDALLGNANVIEKDLLKGAKNAMKKFKATKEYANMNPLTQASIDNAITSMTKAINSKGGFFGGLFESLNDYKDATLELQNAQKAYNKALIEGKEQEISLALQKLNNAKTGVYSAEGQVQQSRNTALKNAQTVMNAATTLANSGDHALATVGSLIGTIGSMLGSTGEMWSGIIGAILQLLDAMGDDFGGFFDNLLNSIISAVGGILKTLTLGGIDINNGLVGADYNYYDQLLGKYEAISKVWDEIIDKKKEYIDISWGEEITAAGEEAKNVMKKQLESQKKLAKAILESGASWGSHTIGQRMWDGSYEFDGQTWNDVNEEISKKLGVKFNGMEDMLNMTGEQLQWIKENYSGLWAVMDGDFRNYLEDIIKYEEEIEDINDSTKERLTQTNFDSLRDSFVDALMDMEKSSEDFTQDFAKLMMNAMVNNTLLGSAFDEWLKEWWERMSAAVEAGDLEAQRNLEKEADEKRKSLLAERDAIASALNYNPESSESSTLTSGIKSITEETADLLASYVNAIRADVSVTREMLAGLNVTELSATAASQLAQLNMIQQNTEAIMQSNANIRDDLRNLYEDVHGGFNGTKSLSIK